MNCRHSSSEIGFRAASWCLVVVLASVVPSCTREDDASSGSRDVGPPNILLLVADDLGYSDLGFMGSEIATPHLDSLAARGALFSHFTVGPTCSPSRAMLLTGHDNHRAGFGTMEGMLSPEQEGQPGYETYLSPQTPTIAEMLNRAGYATFMVGKWHLGKRPSPDMSRLADLAPEELGEWRATLPEARGFERATYILQGGSSHWDDGGITGGRVRSDFVSGGVSIELPDDFYSSTFFTDRLIELIEEDRSNERPFFAYAAYTAPHWPLHAPAELIAKYEGAYDAGYQAVQARRLEEMKRRGLVTTDVTTYPGAPPWRRWEELDAAQRRREARNMEVYAGMVEALDREIGRLLSYLEDLDELDNTLVVFLSDNGPDGNNPLDLPGTREWVRETYDNSLANVGAPGSFVFQGPGWAQVSATPFRLYKGFLSEGGTATPAVFAWGDRLTPTSSDQLATVLDVVPTLLDAAGVASAVPGASPEDPSLPGTSLLPFARSEAASVHGEDGTFAMELFNRRAVRKGAWKLLWLNEPWGKDRWELFDLGQDPGETRDLASSRPEVVAELLEVWEDYIAENGVVLMEEFQLGYTNGTSYYEDLTAMRSPSSESW